MSKTRKVLSLLLALAMVFATLAVSASAASYYEDEEAAEANTQTWALGEPVDNGDGTYSVDVSLTTNYATGPIQFVITNTDNTIAAIESAALGAAIPAAYNASISASNATGKVIIVPSTAGVQTIAAQAIDGVIATITYTYSGSGSAKIAIDNNPKSETNPAGSLIAARMSDGDVVTGDPITGQTVTATGEERTIGAAAVVELDLAIEDAYKDSGIIIDKNKTLNGAYDGVVYGFTLPDNGSVTKLTAANYQTWLKDTRGNEITVTSSPYGRNSFGTGTTIKVMDGTTVAKTYVVVIFGDLTGDSLIGTGDITRCVAEQEVNGTYALPQIMAANVVVAGRNDATKAANLYATATNDVTTLVAVIEGKTEIQVSLATGHYTYSATNYA